ncbi:hypothetical protein GUITHDRAFT_122863, partial [Guillardia theta CCMP2712]
MPNPQELCDSEQAELSGRKVAGGRWGSSERFKAKKQNAEVGPGHYQPDVSKVVRRTPGARICPPTRKNLAAHLNEFQKLLEKSEVGPGKYSPQYFATSEWVSTHAPCIPQPRIASTARVIQTHDCEALYCKSQRSGYALSEKSFSDRKSVGCLKWMPDYFPERPVQHTPGPGSYDPLFQFVSERIPGSSWQRSSLSSNGKLSQAILSHANDIVPGPGSYDVKTDLLFRRSSSALFVSSRQLETSEDESWGDKLILQPNFSLVHPRIRCSVTYREPSVLSLASTERAASTSSVSSLDSSCLSILSTKRRSLSYSFCKGVGSRNQSRNYKTIGPSDYMPNYKFVSRRTATCVIARAHRGLLEKEQQRELYGDVLYIDPETSYKTTVKTQPRIVFSRHKKPSFLSHQTSYLGPNDSGVLVGKLAEYTPSIDMSRTSARASASKDEDARLGPGYYYVDDTLTARRVPAAFISPPAPEDEVEEDREGDRLVLETSAADEMTRRRVVMMVDIGRQMGREEATRRDRAPEALDYNPEVPRDIRGFSMATQSSRKENDQGGEGSHLLNKYQASYSLVENSGRAYSIGKSKRTSEDGGEEEDRGGDVLILDTNKGWEYLRVRHDIAGFDKQEGRPEAVAGQHLSSYLGPNDSGVLVGKLAEYTPSIDMSRTSARASASKDEDARLGPGYYYVDDTLTARRVPAAFISPPAPEDEVEEDREGDRLVLETSAADEMTRRRVVMMVDIGRQMGREEATRRDRAPEALDYNPEVPRDIRGFSMATQSSRKENDQGGEGSHLLNKYQASYSLVENSGRAYSIGKSKRTSEDGGEEEDRGGDVLILDTNKGWEYLRVRHGIVEFGKLTGRVSEIIESSDPSQDLVDWEGARGVAEKTLGFVDFSRMTARKEPFSATTSAVLGPGAYEIQDHLLFRDCFHVSFGRQRRFSDDKYEDDEGDRLVLYPERAESLIRPNIPSFTFIFQPSALVSEWASKKIFVRGHDGELFELPSIGSRVRMKQLSEIFSAWRRPDFYEIKETLTRKSCYQKTLVDIGKASNVRKVDIGMKLQFDDTISTSLPIVKQIHKGGLLDKAGSIQKGDKIVKIVGKDGRTMDLHRWAMKSRNKGASRKLPADTSNQVNHLGPWRECVISSPGTSTRSRTQQHSFFFNVQTKEKLWSFDVWSRKDEVVRNIMQEIEELQFPITIHFRRHQSHCTLQVLVENFQDFLYGAYDPKYDLVERDLRSVSDFVTANGRESSLEAKARMRLFQKNMTLSALKTLPTHLAAPPSEATNRDFTSQKLALRDKHERMFRSLREKHKQEAEEIDGEEAESLKLRHSQERKSLRKKIRREEEALERSLQEQQLISLDKSEIEREVSKIVLQQHLELDAGARLRETERQRRVRFAPENEALLHTAAYSQAAPAGKKWIQKGKSHTCPDVRGLTDQEVQDWKLHTEYRGFSGSDDLVK